MINLIIYFQVLCPSDIPFFCCLSFSRYILAAETKCQTTYITFQEAIEELRKVDLEKYTNQIRPQNRLTGFASLWNSVFGPPKLHKDLLQERNFIFSVALHQLDNTNRVHVGILQTLYKMLTGRKIDCERFGAHWEEIGFQGDQFPCVFSQMTELRKF